MANRFVMDESKSGLSESTRIMVSRAVLRKIVDAVETEAPSRIFIN